MICIRRQTPIKGPTHNYDPHNFDDVYADEYGGYGSGNFRTDNGGGGGGGGGARFGGNERGLLLDTCVLIDDDNDRFPQQVLEAIDSMIAAGIAVDSTIVVETATWTVVVAAMVMVAAV